MTVVVFLNPAPDVHSSKGGPVKKRGGGGGYGFQNQKHKEKSKIYKYVGGKAGAKGGKKFMR